MAPGCAGRICTPRAKGGGSVIVVAGPASTYLAGACASGLNVVFGHLESVWNPRRTAFADTRGTTPVPFAKAQRGALEGRQMLLDLGPEVSDWDVPAVRSLQGHVTVALAYVPFNRILEHCRTPE